MPPVRLEPATKQSTTEKPRSFSKYLYLLIMKAHLFFLYIYIYYHIYFEPVNKAKLTAAYKIMELFISLCLNQ